MTLGQVFLERITDLIPQTWTARQVTEFFLATAVGHAHTAGTMTTEEMKEHIDTLIKRLDKKS